ncbi:3-carboxy-cis,cis-muconate cycloisomerase [Thermoactinospora rubra]|uniref:3-carboxy-cis,cis-muconate cycloisomerase n=1 Tax=Thermoactinospora rubra TaxID=1088767 RepID=UPI000A115F25|nr:3-carboxy-cis,cis-muconate cycloisomerase [Thermoactinospora rubra]
MTDSGLLSPVWAGSRVAAVTSDEAWLRAMLDVEAALARAQAELGEIPAGAAERIGEVAATLTVDLTELAREARQSANPVVPLVARLRAAVGEEHAGHVHRGATSQDILDTATALVTRRAVEIVRADLRTVMAGLAELAHEHRHTPMAARTLGRRALPTTFGLRAATWLAGVLDTDGRLARPRLPVQLGGAAGTLAGYGPRALELAELVAAGLGLPAAPVPWQSERSMVAELGSALAGVTGALGKIATDVVLLAQDEVGELAESSLGSSSAMPHKRNPALSVLIRSAALQVASYAQVLAAAQLGELDRAAGAWQAEWQPLRECLRLAGGAAHTAAELVSGLKVFPKRMRANAEGLPGDVGAAAELVDRILAGYRNRSRTGAEFTSS